MSIPELTGLLIDSKEQFTTRLTEVVSPFVLNTLDEIHTEASNNETWTRGHVYQFQKILKGVPKWNADIINLKTNEILACVPWFNDLIAASIVTQTKVLSSIRLSSDMPDVKLKIPDSTSFVATMYSEIARILYYNPNVPTTEIDRVIYEAIERTIRKLIPFQDILESYLATGAGVENDAQQDDSDSSSSSSSSSSSDEENDDTEMYMAANQHVDNMHQNLNIAVPDHGPQQSQQPQPYQSAFDSDDDDDGPDPRAGALGAGHTFQPPQPQPPQPQPPQPQPPQPQPPQPQPPQLFSPESAPTKLIL